MQAKTMNFIMHKLMNRYTLGFSAILLLASCRKTEVINKIENVVELGTYETSGFLSNTGEERALLNNYETLLQEIAKAKSGSIQDSLDQKKSQTLSVDNLKNLLYASAGQLSIPVLATKEYKSWILDDPLYMQKIAIASANSHYSPKLALQTSGGRFPQYNGLLFDAQGFETYEVVKNTFLSISYQRVFTELLTKEKVTLANVDKALALYGAPTSFPNGFAIVNANGSLVSDKFAAYYAAQRDNAYGTAQGGYYSIIKTQFISLQKQLRSNALNSAAISKNIDSIRVNWEKALMATAVHHLDLTVTNLSAGVNNDSLYAQALHNTSIASTLIRSFRGVTAAKIIADSDINETLAFLYASNANENLRQLLADPSRIQSAIQKLKTIYKYSNVQIGDYFKKDDILNRNIGARY